MGELAAASFTNGKSDMDAVSSLYNNTFEIMSKGVLHLEYSALLWGPEEAPCLADCLPRFINCRGIHLWGNEFEVIGGQCLGPAFAKMPKLTSMFVSAGMFGVDGMDLLVNSLPLQLNTLNIDNGGFVSTALEKHNCEAFLALLA